MIILKHGDERIVLNHVASFCKRPGVLYGESPYVICIIMTDGCRSDMRFDTEKECDAMMQRIESQIEGIN